MIVPRGDEEIRPGDRVVVIASPASARAWCRLALTRPEERVDDIVIFGAGRMGTAIARVLLERGIRVRLIDSRAIALRDFAEALADVRVFHADAFDPGFLERERIGGAARGLLPERRRAEPLRRRPRDGARRPPHGRARARPDLLEVYERGGVDVAINPRQLTAEEMVRFAHDPRIRQIAMLDGDRFEILDITVREDSALADTPFKDLPATNSLIGAVIRNGAVMFPHGSDVLHAGDRVIIFVEAQRASAVERAS